MLITTGAAAVYEGGEPPIVDSDLRLNRMYAMLNRRYWNSALPNDTSIWWEPDPGAYGTTSRIERTLVIRLDPSILGMSGHTELILTHEMAHVATWERARRLKDHGEVFDREIESLTGFKAHRRLL